MAKKPWFATSPQASPSLMKPLVPGYKPAGAKVVIKGPKASGSGASGR